MIDFLRVFDNLEQKSRAKLFVLAKLVYKNVKIQVYTIYYLSFTINIIFTLFWRKIYIIAQNFNKATN